MKALLALPLLLAAPSPSAPPLPDGEATALLEKAEGRASTGKYREAQRLYRKLAKDFAGTPAPSSEPPTSSVTATPATGWTSS